MSASRQPTASEVLDLMDRLQRDESRRAVLGSSWSIYEAAVDDKIIGRGGIDLLAQCMQELWDESLIAHGLQNAGVVPPPVWDGAWIQQLHNWRVTADGRRDTKLFRDDQKPDSVPPPSPLIGGAFSGQHSHDIFISHASEDKDAVARPLVEALGERGWTVWLDALELTVGDSLTGRIDQALARTRFGVVVLSQAFFAKDWPQRELAGLAAREMASGAKVILPVWHDIDYEFIVERSPILADRLGVKTSAGLDKVADEVSRALEKSGMSPTHSPTPSLIERLEEDGNSAPGLLSIPSTPEAQERVVAERPEYWEYQFFAGVLMRARLDLEGKWHDHELGLPGGVRRDIGQESPLHFLNREMDWLRRQISVVGRLFDAISMEQAFGKSGEPGDPARIEHLARRLTETYEAMMDWSAEIRNTNAPSEYAEIVELYARLANGPVRQIRDFIQEVADKTTRLPILAMNGTEENPAVVEFKLTLSLEDGLEDQLTAALEKLRAEY
jgi:hypothetical protein